MKARLVSFMYIFMGLFSSVIGITAQENQVISLCPCHTCIYEKIKKTDEVSKINPTQVIADGITFTFRDLYYDGIVDIIREINEGDYPLKKYNFKPNDIVVDIGAHVGIISIMLAKLNPHITVYAVEACPANFNYLVHNIKENKVTNVHPFNLAITAETGKRVIIHDWTEKQACSTQITLHSPERVANTAESLVKKWEVSTMSFDDFMTLCNIEKCKLLKIDCEGSEYEILLNSKKFKQKIVEDMVGEFHMNNSLKSQGYSFDQLSYYCRQHVLGDLHIKTITMHD